MRDSDLAEARWSAERALFYLERLVKQEVHAQRQVLELLQEIANSQADQEAALAYAARIKLLVKRKSLWQHLREDDSRAETKSQ